jgi:hypothetical protein
LRAEARRGDCARAAGATQAFLRLAALEQRDNEARGERVARGRSVDRVHERRARARDLPAILQ